MSCRDCGADHLVHDDVASLVCTNCGTLVDTTQTVLAAHLDHPNTSSYLAPRNSKGWRLAETKQDRDRKNTMAMNNFIRSVLAKLNNPGLSPRAEAIFTQAMTKGNYRWGRKARRAAGASIAIALREAHKSDSLRDIAFFLDDSPVSLARAFQSVVLLLDFSLAATDPAVHLSVLQSHLHSATLSPSQLPKSLATVLTSLSLQAAVRTAASLSQIISDHTPPLALNNLPTPPTACALLILGLEAELRAPLPHLKELARTLATRFALGHGVVSSRYKIIYDLIEEWIRHVPWLDQFTYKGKCPGLSARSKIPKRGIVAKGIKDVIQFRQEIWSSRMQAQQKVDLNLELDEEEEEQSDDENVNVSIVASSNKRVREPDTALSLPGKRRKIDEKNDAVLATYRRFLNPLSSSDTATFNRDVSLLSRMLTCSPNELARARGTLPTRLQLLAASRGGSTEEHITDEELFADGELEGLLRNEQEREALLPLFQLNWGEDTSNEEATVRPDKPVAAETKRGAKRVDMDAFARLLGVHDRNDEEDAAFPDPDDTDTDQWGWDDYIRHPLEHPNNAEGAELASDWRPAFDDTDIFRGFADTVDGRYEEEL